MRAELDAAIGAAAAPATALIVDRRVASHHEFPPTSTHFGGQPYAEPGDSWPTTGERRPYDFICQINLRECPVRPDVPLDLVTVFVCWKSVEEADMAACVVRGYRDPSVSKAVELHRPAPLEDDDYRVVGCTVRTERRLTYPWSFESHPAIAAAAAKFRNRQAAYEQSLRRLGYRDQSFSRVGGFPRWVHDNTLEYGDLVFLAQIAYEPKARNCIGDAAPIFIAVSASDPTTIETDVFQSY